MSFIILSCSAPIPQHETEDAVRTLLSAYGEVGGVLVARRGEGDAPWVAAVEMRSGLTEAMRALEEAEIEGQRMHLRRAKPYEIEGLQHAI